MTQEEIDGICEIWTVLPNKKPGLSLPIRAAFTPDQVEEIKKLIHLGIAIQLKGEQQ